MTCIQNHKKGGPYNKREQEVDNKLGQHTAKIMASGRVLLKSIEADVPEDEIKELVRDLVLENDDPGSNADVYSENQIRCDIIQKTGCDVRYADAFLQKMKNLGLELCKRDNVRSPLLMVRRDYSQMYHLGAFANLRSYISDKESNERYEKRRKIREEIRKEEEEELASLNPKEGNACTS